VARALVGEKTKTENFWQDPLSVITPLHEYRISLAKHPVPCNQCEKRPEKYQELQFASLSLSSRAKFLGTKYHKPFQSIYPKLKEQYPFLLQYEKKLSQQQSSEGIRPHCLDLGLTEEETKALETMDMPQSDQPVTVNPKSLPKKKTKKTMVSSLRTKSKINMHHEEEEKKVPEMKKTVRKAEATTQEKEEETPMCYCGVKAARRMIRKEGPNQGTYFFGCPHFRVNGHDHCEFWAKSFSTAPIPRNSNTNASRSRKRKQEDENVIPLYLLDNPKDRTFVKPSYYPCDRLSDLFQPTKSKQSKGLSKYLQ
jgi:hypothetical protein